MTTDLFEVMSKTKKHWERFPKTIASINKFSGHVLTLQANFDLSDLFDLFDLIYWNNPFSWWTEQDLT